MKSILATIVALAAIAGAVYVGQSSGPSYPPPPAVPGPFDPTPTPSPGPNSPLSPGGVVRAQSIEIVTATGGVSVRITTQGDRAVAEVWDGRKFTAIDLQKVARLAN